MLIHDKTNARVVDDIDDHVFYTDDLTCNDDVIDEVVTLANTTDIDNWIGSGGVIDDYLLDAECTTEDKEHIIENLFNYLTSNS
jgi:hypothetical protein